MYQEVVCRVIVYCVYKSGIFSVLLFPFRVFIITTVELHMSVGSQCRYLDHLYLYNSGHIGMISRI